MSWTILRHICACVPNWIVMSIVKVLLLPIDAYMISYSKGVKILEAEDGLALDPSKIKFIVWLEPVVH